MHNSNFLLVTVRNRINSNYEQLGELKKQLRTAQLIIENSEKYALLAQRRYENGEGALLELQNSEEEVLNAELGYLSSLYQYYLTLATISNTLGVEEEELCFKITKKGLFMSYSPGRYNHIPDFKVLRFKTEF